MAEQDDTYTHYRTMHEEILASGGTRNAARWWSTTAWWEERKKLSQDAEFRADEPEPHSAYEGYDHDQLKRMVTDGLSVSQVGDVSEAWSRLANAMAEFGERLSEQVTRSEAVWQGEAAESAKEYTRSMATWSEATGKCAQLVSHQVSMQGDAASRAHNRMPDPVQFDLRQEMSGWPQNPQNMNALVLQTLQRQQAQQDAKQEAVTVMTDYDSSLQEAAARQPVFPPPPKLTHGAGTSTSTAIPATTPPPAIGDAAGTTTAAAAAGPAGYGPGGPGYGPGGVPGYGPGGVPGQGPGGAPANRPGLGEGRQAGVGRTNPAMPFQSGGAGVPFGAAAASGARPGMMPGFLGAPGATARGEEDKEHTNSYVVEDWDDTGYWYDDLPRPVAPVIGSDVLTPTTQPEDPEQPS